MPVKAKAPTAAALLAVLTRYQPQLNGEWDYKKIKPFTFPEVQDFLDGHAGAVVGNYGYTRSNQVVQAISAIGAHVVDRDKADDETFAVYKGVWGIEFKKVCQYCGKSFKYVLMMGKPSHCPKARCVLAAMRDSM